MLGSCAAIDDELSVSPAFSSTRGEIIGCFAPWTTASINTPPREETIRPVDTVAESALVAERAFHAIEHIARRGPAENRGLFARVAGVAAAGRPVQRRASRIGQFRPESPGGARPVGECLEIRNPTGSVHAAVAVGPDRRRQRRTGLFLAPVDEGDSGRQLAGVGIADEEAMETARIRSSAVPRVSSGIAARWRACPCVNGLFIKNNACWGTVVTPRRTAGIGAWRMKRAVDWVEVLDGQ